MVSSSKWKAVVVAFLNRKANETELKKLVEEDDSIPKKTSYHPRHIVTGYGSSTNHVGIATASVRSKIETATSKSLPSESNTRFTLDILLIYAHDIATSGNSISGRDISVQTGKQWTYGPVRWNHKNYTLVGKPDYTVWYGESEQTALNVVVVEAKRRYFAGNGLVQCLGYMGVVHKLRKEAGKENCTVYGMTSDGQTFIFLKINERSEWSERNITTRTQDYTAVLGLLVHFLRTATTMSPSNSKKSSTYTKEKSDSITHSTRTLYGSSEMEGFRTKLE
ncbi:hypothetical protein N7463_009414 [Penicillium fimorum]|uniref:Uncharacterized protein n=1 Tax=Penicillium fimorum TaxID=1882269 RepID=A0A9W9XQQ6_9EURO|nr:hypothetical protein N7463_009414 [Penicillium fimorum]